MNLTALHGPLAPCGRYGPSLRSPARTRSLKWLAGGIAAWTMLAASVAVAQQGRCRIETTRPFGETCRAFAATTLADGEDMSFMNIAPAFRGRVTASCRNGVLSWDAGQCAQAAGAAGAPAPVVANQPGVHSMQRSMAAAPAMALAATASTADAPVPSLEGRRVLVSRPPWVVQRRDGARRVVLGLHGTRDDAPRTHDFVAPFVNSTTRRSNALTIQTPVSIGGSVQYVNLSDTSQPPISNNPAPGRVELVSEGLRVAYLANDPASNEKLRTQINAWPIPTRTPLLWDLSVRFGGDSPAEAWPLTRYTASPVLIWQLKVDPGFPSMGILVDTDPADNSALMLTFFQRLYNTPGYSQRWTVNGLRPGEFQDIVIQATLDDREPHEGGGGRLGVWVNGQELVQREGRNLIRDLPDVHRWAFGLYQTAESQPIPLTKVTLWRRARLLLD